MPKVVLGVRSPLKYAGSSIRLAAAFGGRFCKLAEDDSGVKRNSSSNSKCGLYILDSVCFRPSLLVDGKENSPIDAVLGGKEEVFDCLAIVMLQRTKEANIEWLK